MTVAIAVRSQYAKYISRRPAPLNEIALLNISIEMKVILTKIRENAPSSSLPFRSHFFFNIITAIN